MKPARSYGDLARHYTAFIRARGCDHDPWVAWLLAAAKKFGVSGKRVLSLGCGNGLAEMSLARRGYDITGVDSSADMLKQARREIKGSARSLSLVQADITTYSPRERYDLVFSHYYTINYITTLADLRRCFKNVYACMDRGGLFVFDTKYITRDASGGRGGDHGAIFYEQGGLYTILKRRRLKNNIVRNEYINFFLTENAGLYEMNRELHVQRFYRADEYQRALLSAGFEEGVIFLYRYMTFSPSVKESGRSVYVCRKT